MLNGAPWRPVDGSSKVELNRSFSGCCPVSIDPQKNAVCSANGLMVYIVLQPPKHSPTQTAHKEPRSILQQRASIKPPTDSNVRPQCFGGGMNRLGHLQGQPENPSMTLLQAARRDLQPGTHLPESTDQLSSEETSIRPKVLCTPPFSIGSVPEGSEQIPRQ